VKLCVQPGHAERAFVASGIRRLTGRRRHRCSAPGALEGDTHASPATDLQTTSVARGRGDGAASVTTRGDLSVCVCTVILAEALYWSRPAGACGGTTVTLGYLTLFFHLGMLLICTFTEFISVT
jgi:hypothetical protein